MYIQNKLLAGTSIFQLLLGGLVIILSMDSFGQGISTGNRRFEGGSYSKAIEAYKEQLKDPANDQAFLNYRIGESYLRMNFLEDAMHWLQSAQRLGYKKAEILYSLGEINLLLGKYDEALNYFTSYSQQQANDKRTAAKIASCHWGKIENNAKAIYSLTPVESINTTGSEYGIAYNHNGQLLYASTGAKAKLSKSNTSARTGLGYSSLHLAQGKKGGGFMPGIMLVDASDDLVNRGVVSYNPDDGMYYCTTCVEGEKDCYISVLKIKGKYFREVDRLVIGNTASGIGHPFVVNKGKTIYFTSTMPGGYGGDDIWYAQKLDNGKWSKPINAGPEVNTAGNEVFPYVYNQYLYFASEGHVGYGGLDLYVSEINESKHGKAFNLRAPFNSEKDDFNLIINSDGKGGFMVSNRNNEASSDNIYQFMGLPCVKTIEGRVYDKETGQKLAMANVTVSTIKGQGAISLTTDSLAQYSFHPQGDETYKASASLEGYLTTARDFDFNHPCFAIANQENGFNTDFYLERIPKPEKITYLEELPITETVIRDIYYDFDLAKINADASVELNKIVEVMKKHSHLNLRITSYCDIRGSKQYNERLSIARSDSAAAFIQRQGISPDRIERQGLGASQFVFKDAKTEEEQRFNRRASFLLFSNTSFPDDQLIRVISTQELLNQEQNKMAKITGWWIFLDAERSNDQKLMTEVEQLTGKKVNALKLDDGLIYLCIGSFKTSEEAMGIVNILKGKDIKTELKDMTPTDQQ